MQLTVDRLTSTPSDHAYELDSGWWCERMPREPGLPQQLLETIEVKLRAHRQGDMLHLEGVVGGAIALDCSRCLARYRHAFRESFRLVLEPADLRPPADPEATSALARDGVCLGDELELGCYRGDEIRLDSVCHEVIALALPVQPLCDTDCKGLCASCGAVRGTESCDCDDVAPESPFAVLAALRGRNEGVN